MALDLYRRKRDFTRTREPPGTEGGVPGHAYLIQKHAARRLHYDLRLEMDGVLKSWAVTRGPSLVAGEKRLAVHVEDHPLDYGSFEGTIPEGQYGGGAVMLWDTGIWAPVGDARMGYEKGHLTFDLKGHKLQGRWHLVRMRPRRGDDADNWLLIKAQDDAARARSARDILDEQPASVKTGRTLEEIAAEAGARPKARAAARRTSAAAVPKARSRRPAGKAKPQGTAEPGVSAPLPDFMAPQLATLVAKPPAGKAWIHEIKLDGYRLQARIDHQESGRKTVRILTRSGLDWTARFGPQLVAALDALPARQALIDGELVVETEAGASNFSLLQQDLSEERSDRLLYYAFDLLHLDGRDLTDEPLTVRAEALRTLFKDAGAGLRLSMPFVLDGPTILSHACRLSLEGLVSKRAAAPYRSGRGKDWLKSKCALRQEFVIGGYVPSTAHKEAVGALVLGVFENGDLRHVGRVGTGFSQRVARDLHRRLARIAQDRSPFTGALTADEKRDVTFVAPELVAEVEFRSWTGDAHLRHAAFRGLREDKPAAEIVREEAAVDEAAPARKSLSSRVRLSHPDRIYWPDDGITKAGLADYYAEVWTLMAPFIVARPLALLRCPDGIAGECFFQKHAWRGINAAVKLRTDTDGEPLLVVEDFDGLIALVQAGALELHAWGAALADLERPDIMIFDLDPGPGVAWEAVVAGAREVRARLEAQGLPAFVKTSGGKGLHVATPLVPDADWAAVKAFAKALAEAMAAEAPDRYVAVATKARRSGRIFIDYLRNGRGATAVAPYGPRARPGAGVAMPVAWEELDVLTGAAQFTLADAPVRLANLTADPWGGFRAAAVPLPAVKGSSRRPRAR